MPYVLLILYGCQLGLYEQYLVFEGVLIVLY